jgi:predicted acylesterase/phospholipase RssA
MDPACYGPNPAGPLMSLAADAAYFAEFLLQRTPAALLSSDNLANRFAQTVDFSALVDLEPFRALIERTIDFERVRVSSRLLRVAATNWVTGVPVTFENRDLTPGHASEVIQASAAIPALFPPVRVGGDVFVDGGVVVNTPLNCAIEAGATELHVVYMDPDVQNIPLRRLQSTIGTFDRLYTVLLASKMNEDIDTAAWINEGIQAVGRLAAGKGSESDEDLFVRVAARLKNRMSSGKYRQISIHRYHPHDDLGGALGMLNFEEEKVARLIHRGFADTAVHDCQASHCILAADADDD